MKTLNQMRLFVGIRQPEAIGRSSWSKEKRNNRPKDRKQAYRIIKFYRVEEVEILADIAFQWQMVSQ